MFPFTRVLHWGDANFDPQAEVGGAKNSLLGKNGSVFLEEHFGLFCKWKKGWVRFSCNFTHVSFWVLKGG